MAKQKKRGEYEKSLTLEYDFVIGVDEVGRGCLAGPVYAACVVIDYKKLFALEKSSLELIRDSKTLSAKQRELVQPLILDFCTHVAVAAADVDEIDEHNILQATFIAMRRAIAQCNLTGRSIALVDGHQKIREYEGEQVPIVDGDAHTYAIAAASILAKQARDTYMQEQSLKFPVYGFERHVGYGTSFHLQMLKQHGACPLHRRSFTPVAEILRSNQQPELIPN